MHWVWSDLTQIAPSVACSDPCPYAVRTMVWLSRPADAPHRRQRCRLDLGAWWRHPRDQCYLLCARLRQGRRASARLLLIWKVNVFVPYTVATSPTSQACLQPYIWDVFSTETLILRLVASRATCGTNSSKKSACSTTRRSNPRTQHIPASARIAQRASPRVALALQVSHKIGA